MKNLMKLVIGALLLAPLVYGATQRLSPPGSSYSIVTSYSQSGSYTHNQANSTAHVTIGASYYNTQFHPAGGQEMWLNTVVGTYTLKTGDSVLMYSGMGPIPEWQFVNGLWQPHQSASRSAYTEHVLDVNIIAAPNVAPSASISASATTITSSQSATITFSASDGNGNLASWRFRKSDNPGAGWSSASGGTAGPGTYSFSGTPGTHTFYLEVVDRDGASASDSVSITVLPQVSPKREQVVSLSPAVARITTGNSVSFSASGGGGSGAWVWSGASGSGASAYKTFSSAGTFTVSVYRQGDSDYLASNTASATITVDTPAVGKSDQIVNLSPGSSSIYVGESVSFSASGGNGTGSWVWSGASGSGTSAYRTFASAGTYTISVYRNGDTNYNVSNTANATVVVQAAGKANQFISLSPATSHISAGDSVSFSASGGNGTGTWVWSGASGSGSSAFRTFSSPGTYSVTVYRGGDASYNQSNTASATVHVEAVKSAQTVSISPKVRTIAVGESVSFSASGGNGTGSWIWSGASGTGPSAVKQFGSTGTYAVSVYRQGDANYNDSNVSSATITVDQPRDDQTIAITPATASITAGESVSFSASGGAGSGGWIWSGATGVDNTASETFSTAGTYNVSVYKAGDSSYNASNTATATVTVAERIVVTVSDEARIRVNDANDSDKNTQHQIINVE